MKRKMITYVCGFVSFFVCFSISLYFSKQKRENPESEIAKTQILQTDFKTSIARSFDFWSPHSFINNHLISQICCHSSEWETCFDLEIADNNETRQLWLMYRKSLSENDWMLFIFEKSDFYNFWMKNTLIPLAWIRLNQNLQIVDIISMDPCTTQECISYSPKNKAKYVLEINQNLITKQELKIWTQCRLVY